MTTMYFTDDGLVISAREITEIIVAIVIVAMMSNMVYRKISSIATNRSSKSEDYPYHSRFEDRHMEIERQEKVIFEEVISNVTFRYDEHTKMLTIGERSDVSDAQQIKVKLSSLDDLREFVDRLEEYVNE